MTNIATLLETAIAQALPDNWQQEPETHLPALSLIISNILLPNCCQMSNLNSFDRRICCFKTAACCLQK
jgi:hypothetical protein